MWYLIVSIPDLCTLTYFVLEIEKNIQPHHRRRKVFNIGGPNPARPTSVLGWGGSIAESTNMHACTCMHTHVLTIHTPIDVCMHLQHMQVYILHPDTKVIKLRASDLFEKKTARNIYN